MLKHEDTVLDEYLGPGETASSVQEREIQEWARILRIPPSRLKEAVSAVGITPRKIREYLRLNQ